MNRRHVLELLLAVFSPLTSAEWWKSTRRSPELIVDRCELDEDYLRLIAWVESLPENQAGSDKTWIHRCIPELHVESRDFELTVSAGSRTFDRLDDAVDSPLDSRPAR